MFIILVLKNHSGHEIAKKQMNGYGGIVTCVLSGGLEAAKRFLETCQIFQLAESLGRCGEFNRTSCNNDTRSSS